MRSSVCAPTHQLSQSFLGVLIVLVLLGSSGRGSGGGPPAAGRPGAEQPAVFGYRVQRELPHDSAAFLQGLQYDRRCDGEGSNCRWARG